MKKSIYILVISAFLFAGCSNLPDTNTTATTSSTSSNIATPGENNSTSLPPASTTTPTSTTAPEKNKPDVTPVIEQPVDLKVTADEQMRHDANEKMDLATCDKISDSTIKQGCQIDVILRKVQTDQNYCKTLTDGELKDICQGLLDTQFSPT